MRRIIFLPTALILTALTLTGCASAGSGYDSTESGGSVTPMTGQVVPESPEGLRLDGDTASQSVDRQVITTGYVTVTVDEPQDAAAEAARIAESVGGRVDGRQEYAPLNGDKGSATLTLRLPADSLDATLEKLKELGKVREVSISASDVTMVTQDLDARIKALRTTIDRFLTLSATATDTDSLIKLETAISERQAELESLESQQRYYADQVSLSTITLNLVSVADTPVDEPNTFLSGLFAGWNAFVAFFAGLLVALGVLLPWLIFAGLITFLVIFLVRRARRRAEAPAAPVVEEPKKAAAKK